MTRDLAKFSEKFANSVGVRQGCVLSPSLFNVFLEEIVSRTVEVTGGVSVQGLLVNNLRFADDVVLITDNSNELQDLIKRCRLNTESTRFEMEISAEKSKTLGVGKTPETLEHLLSYLGNNKSWVVVGLIRVDRRMK